MKADIHPKYFEAAKVVCSCGNTMTIGSTRESLKTELCAKCHPFYTGQHKLVDTAGRVDKFQAKMQKAQELKDQEIKRAEEKKKKPEGYKEKEIPSEVIERATKWGSPVGDTMTEEVKKEQKAAEKKPAAKKPATKKAATKKAVSEKPAKKAPAAKKKK